MSYSLLPPSKIQPRGLCEAVANFIVKHPNRLPKQEIRAGTYLWRTIPQGKLVHPPQGGLIFSAPGGDKNRMDGITPMGATRPALYVGDKYACLAEGLH